MDSPMSDSEAIDESSQPPPAKVAFFGWTLPPEAKYKLHTLAAAPVPPVLTSSYGQQTNPAPAEVEIRRTSSSRAFAAAMGEARNWTQEFNAILRDYFKLRGTIPKLLKDFEEAATAIGRTIISERNLPPYRKSIPPLAKGELGVAGGEKYLCGSIFFKYAVDLFGIYGSDHYAQKAAGLELKHLNTLFSLGRICSFPLMCIIDYRGWRLIASSVLPIRDATIVYGSNDQGQTVHTSDDSFNAMMQEIGRKLNLKPHLVRGAHGLLKEIVGPIDIEGHIGDDGNRYLVDYQRLMPPETPNGMQGVHLYRLLRPELVRANPVPLSSDAFSTWGAHDAERHNNEVNDATTRLRLKLIPEMAARIAAMDPNTLDPFQLITGVQRQGINVRYLGLLADALPPPARSLLLLEMIARTLRSRLHEQLRKVSSPLEEEYKGSLVEFLNLAFGSSPASDQFWRFHLVQELNTRFISMGGRPLGTDPRPEISMERLLHRLEELSGAALLPAIHARLSPTFFARPLPFTTGDIFAIEPRVKRMTSWLDPRAFQVTGGLKEEAEGAVVIDNAQLTSMKFLVEGVTGNIYKAKWNGQDVAVTQFHNDNEFKQFLTVVEELCKLSHPHLVRIFGLVRAPGSCVAEFIDGGTLDSFLEDEDNELTWPLRFRLAEEMAKGMLCLHEAEPPFVHRNLTAPNILRLSVKINTVRLTRHVGFSCDTAVMGLIPPEIVEEEHWSEKSDVYCFGIILWQLVTRDLPDLRNDLIPDLPSHFKCPPDYAHILHICLERDPAKRPTFHEIYELLRHGSMRTSIE